MQKNYSFVLDAKGKRLDPTIEQNAWRLVRQHKAKLVQRFPMVIQISKTVDEPNKDEIRCGIDDGGVHVGIALVQKCRTRNKVLFKGTIEQRKDVKKLMTQRRGYRRKRRSEKRYHPARFYNRVSYTYRNGKRYEGYVTALYPDEGKQKAALNFQSLTKHCKKVNARKCKLVYRPSRICWLKCA